MPPFNQIFPKTISTPRLTLHRFRRNDPSHFATLLAAINSPTAHASMGDFGARTPADVIHMFDSAPLRTIPGSKVDFDDLPGGVADGDFWYVMEVRSPSQHRNDRNGGGQGVLIGGISLAHRQAATVGGEKFLLPPDIGWCVVESHMGLGYATEGAQAILDLLIRGCGLRDVICFAGNAASNRVAEKVGFVDGGECPCLDEGEDVVVIYMRPERSEKLGDALRDGIGFHLGNMVK